jgi:hypothetical protein
VLLLGIKIQHGPTAQHKSRRKMAGDWIKMRCNLWDDPRIARICDLCECGEAEAIGALYWLWATADQHTETGILAGLTLKAIDRKTGVQGFGDSLVAIGWLADHPEGVRIVDFDVHNGASAKKRSETARRVARHRDANPEPPTPKNNDDVTLAALQNEYKSDTHALAREEKRRDIKQNTDTEKMARKRAAASLLVSIDDLVSEGVDKQSAADWLCARKAKGLPLTPTAWQQAKDEAKKAGMTVAEAIKTAAGNGWAGFKASWVQEAARAYTQNQNHTKASAQSVASTELADAFFERQAEAKKAAVPMPEAVRDKMRALGVKLTI